MILLCTPKKPRVHKNVGAFQTFKITTKVREVIFMIYVVGLIVKGVKFQLNATPIATRTPERTRLGELTEMYIQLSKLVRITI